MSRKWTRQQKRGLAMAIGIFVLLMLVIGGMMSSDPTNESLARATETMSRTTEGALEGVREAHDSERFAWKVALGGPPLVLLVVAVGSITLVYYLVKSAREDEVETSEMIEMLEQHGVIEMNNNKQLTDGESSTVQLEEGEKKQTANTSGQT